jgi:hypothetical protein
MKKGYLTGMLIICLCAWILTMSSCGGSSGTSVSSGSTKTPVALSTFSEDVAKCTPQLQAGSESIPGAENAGTISNWTGWDPSQQNTIFNNLFTPDCIEGLFDPITKADMFITIINSFEADWQKSGVYDNVTLPIFNTTAKLTVDTSVKSVTIPFFGGTLAVDRLLTIEGDLDGSTGFVAKMAFTSTADGESMVVRTYFPDKGETSMFYGKKATNGELDAWAACFVDHGTPDDTSDDFYMALKWHGNTTEGWFALTQYKNSGGGSKLLAGGSSKGDMAFLAFRGDDVDAALNPYYLICTTDNITGNTQPDGGIINGTDVPPLETNNTVLKYIEVGNTSCLGYLTSYPEQASDVEDLN